MVLRTTYALIAIEFRCLLGALFTLLLVEVIGLSIWTVLTPLAQLIEILGEITEYAVCSIPILTFGAHAF